MAVSTQMDRGTLKNEIKAFVVSNFLFGDVSKSPKDGDSLIEGGIIDSTGILELIQFLEERYKIEIADSETIPDNLGSIEGIASYIIQKTN